MKPNFIRSTNVMSSELRNKSMNTAKLIRGWVAFPVLRQGVPYHIKSIAGLCVQIRIIGRPDAMIECVEMVQHWRSRPRIRYSQAWRRRDKFWHQILGVHVSADESGDYKWF